MKDSPDLYRLVVESMEDVVILEDLQGCILYASPSAQTLTGLTPEELTGRLLRDLIHPDDEPLLSVAVASRAIREREFRCRTCDGLYRWAAACSQHLYDPDGQPFRILHCIRAITERQIRQEEARQNWQRGAIGRLAGGVAHDFNNLLTVITGYTSVLLDAHGPGDPDHEPLTHIQHASERISALVRQLLAIGGRQVLNLAVVDFNALILHRTEVFKRLLGPGIHLNLNLDPSVQSIKVDPEQMEQVLLELIAQAREAMPSGGQLTLATVNLSAEPSLPLPPGPAVRLIVSDTGHGMDEESLAHLFEPFFTSERAARTLGLSLAAVEGTVRQCGGHIAAASRPGAGATFTLTFPAVPAPPAGAETVLLVDDEVGVRVLAAHILRAQGYQVLEACDGEEALDVYARHGGTIHLVISDVAMPRLGGPEMARRLAERAPGLPILFLSGCNKEDADLSMIGGQQPRFLAKPFLPAALIQAAREAIADHRV